MAGYLRVWGIVHTHSERLTIKPIVNAISYESNLVVDKSGIKAETSYSWFWKYTC